MKPGTSLQTEVDFVCPFCERMAGAATTPEMVVVHQEPQCDEFKRLSPDKYLEAVRKRFESESNPSRSLVS